MSSSSNKLHPIYVALDNHQYSRAIKLCLAHPPTLLCQALLAHSYAKAGQRYKALLTIQKILPSSGNPNDSFFPEFQSEIKYLHLVEGVTDAAAAAQAPAISKKAVSKKGKRKVAGNTTQQQQPAAVQASSALSSIKVVPEDWDLIDQLDIPPTLPDDWERLPPAATVTNNNEESSVLDPTVLSTLTMTMTNQLKLPLTAYQLYIWASSASGNSPTNEELFVRKAFTSGLIVLLSPQYLHITSNILSNLQVLALHLTRINSPSIVSPSSLWAAQAALWQSQYAPENIDDEKLKLRLAMLPRLAESLALKCLESLEHNNLTSLQHDEVNSLVSTEIFLLYMRTLDVQKELKFKTKLDAIETKLSPNQHNSTSEHLVMMYPPRQTLLQMKVDLLMKQGQYSVANCTLEELINLYPDDWEYWRLHLKCSIMEADGDITIGCKHTVELANSVAERIKSNRGQKYPLRAPRWIEVEAACERLRAVGGGGSTDQDPLEFLIKCIKRYGSEFAACASSTFSDLSSYMDQCLEICAAEHALSLLEWSKSLRTEPTHEDAKIRRSELRSYICSIQINFKILSKFKDLRHDHLPSWEEIFAVWEDFQRFENSSDNDQAQKESRPADELILLAVQRLLCEGNDKTKKLIAVYLLESAIRYSPYNAYLKIAAILVYAQLDAAARCWDLYTELYIKHIQHETCSYLILPVLRSGGFYRETIHVCQEILGLQRSSAREAGDFTIRAMENGSICKADEFISFHRNRMFKSLTTLEAKGLVLDCAPMFIQDPKQGSVGAVHGIVGGELDLERAKQMITEAHNPTGAFSLLRIKGSVHDNINKFSDNRDFGIISFEILQKTMFDSAEWVLSESIRRGCHHNLLIRATLCVDGTKGPKKGKIAKASPELERRCRSLLQSVTLADEVIDATLQPRGYVKLLDAMKAMCKSLTTLSAGMNDSAELVYDTIEDRELSVVTLLKQASASIQKAQHDLSLKDEISASKTSRLLSDCVIPIFALFQMNAKIADAFGWGRRKRKTKLCAAALADLSLIFCYLIDDMISCISYLSDNIETENLPEVSSNAINQSLFQETCRSVLFAQQVTKSRIEQILDEIKNVLALFHKED